MAKLAGVRRGGIRRAERGVALVQPYYDDGKGTWQFRVSDVRNADYEFLVLLHELIEWYFCYRAGVSEEGSRI